MLKRMQTEIAVFSYAYKVYATERVLNMLHEEGAGLVTPFIKLFVKKCRQLLASVWPTLEFL